MNSELCMLVPVISLVLFNDPLTRVLYIVLCFVVYTGYKWCKNVEDKLQKLEERLKDSES